MKQLLSLRVGEYDLEAPGGIPEGGLLSGEDTTAQMIIQNGIQILFVVAVFLSLVFMIWGGIKWITSDGDKAKVESARKTVIFSVIGLLVVFVSFMIVALAGQLFGVELIEMRSPVSNN